MDREAYNQCMKPHMSGKGKSKEERRIGMCVGAKLCTGKASTEEEALRICSVPKLPKWAKSAEKSIKEDGVGSCEERTSIIRRDLEIIALKVRQGEAEEVKNIAARVLVYTQSCQGDEVFAKAVSAMNDVHELGTRHYLKAESKEAIKNIETLREEIA